MPVLVIADLHLDFWLRVGRDPLAALSSDVLEALDALIIAGDLSNKPKVRWPHMLRHVSRYVEPTKIYVIPGNHDYYDHAIDGDDRLAEICAGVGAHFAQKTEIVISSARFLCCTLWTDFALHGDPALAMVRAQRDINDYRYIRHLGAGYRRIWPSDTAFVHRDHRIWLEDKLATPFRGPTIVVTHHCPHPDLIGERRGDLDPVYGSNLLQLIEHHQPDFWLFGHTHHRVEAEVGRTTVCNVSLAYPDQVPPGDEAAIMLRGLIGINENERRGLLQEDTTRGHRARW